ncbi:MAG: helix-turn-helix transcriptional regulator [Clostridia bacterium]|nr:helix-turn-helix transcriptional regulator [Clostridia bacterium]
MVISYQRLWDLLKERKLTKKELAKRAGISDSTLRVMTRGGNVSLDVLGKICTALRVDIGDVASFVDV